MDAVLEHCRCIGLKNLYLTVVIDNHRARAMYGKRGFVECGQYVNQTDGEIYVQMLKGFTGERVLRGPYVQTFTGRAVYNLCFSEQSRNSGCSAMKTPERRVQPYRMRAAESLERACGLLEPG